MSKRKYITMQVTVTVPEEMTAVQARREVRTLINDQANWRADPDDVVAITVTPIKKWRLER